MTIQDPKAFLADLFHTAVDAADPGPLMRANLPPETTGRTIVIGAGKASGAMAESFAKAWAEAGRGKLEGLVVTAHGNKRTAGPIEIIESSHPVPDAGSETAARRLLDLVSGLSEDDIVVALISGGGSSLLSLPAGPLTDEDKRGVNRALLEGGVPIGEMNCVRKHLSVIKGGRLAAAAFPAKVISLVLSDIPGDDPALVSSGPTIPDVTTREDALAIVERYGLKLPEAAHKWLDNPECAAPDPADPAFARNEVRLIAAAQKSLQAAADAAASAGIDAHILSDAFEGEARLVGQIHAAMARQVAGRNQPFSRPCLLLSGGETTVTLRHKGKGGRNSEFLLSFARHIEGVANIAALAADTDGIDGSENNAGAFADGTSLTRMRTAGVDPLLALDRNDAYTAFEAANDLIVTGPTATNVNDFRAILIL